MSNAQTSSRIRPAGQDRSSLGEKLFTMVVVADTHLSEQDMESNSPFPVNRLANGRMKHVVEDINAIAPEFVINLGDLIHPVPGVPNAYDQAVERFLEQTSKLNCKQYLVPGNHDVGDKPTNWAPAGVVCDEYLGMWEKYFGDHYYAFERDGCHFLVINAQIINTGLQSEQEQRVWLEGYFEKHKGERFFINTHYPPFLTMPEEAEHYDNIAEPGRSWLMDLMENYQVEALFAGHVHNFWFNRYADTDCYLLPSTAFVRQDYSEMYRVPPEEGEEHGRNEDAKLGYFKVNVYENGHVCHVVRTYGRLAGEGEPVKDLVKTDTVHPAENKDAPLGFDLRQTWAEVLEVPPSGGLDEFSRKPVRNDYPLMALWEMGVKKVRVPLQDLMDPYTCERMQVLKEHGHQFTVFSFGLLDDEQRKVLIEYQDLVVSWELTYAEWELDQVAQQLIEINASLDVPIYLSRLRTHDGVKDDGGRYFHVINHGFGVRDEDKMRALLSKHKLNGVADGFVLRLAWKDEPWEVIQAAGKLAKNLKMKISAHVRLADENPAEANYDDVTNANRVAAALIAAKTQPDVDAFVDTFTDNDRGYFVKNGVVDRRANPRLGYHIVRNLYAALNDQDGLQGNDVINLATGRAITFSSNDAFHALVLPNEAMYLKQLVCSASQNLALSSARLVNLETGVITELSSDRNNGDLILDPDVLYQVPTLISWSL